jgi:hypothetical protein
MTVDYTALDTATLKDMLGEIQVCWPGCTRKESDAAWEKLLAIEAVILGRGELPYQTKED